MTTSLTDVPRTRRDAMDELAHIIRKASQGDMSGVDRATVLLGILDMADELGGWDTKGLARCVTHP